MFSGSVEPVNTTGIRDVSVLLTSSVRAACMSCSATYPKLYLNLCYAKVPVVYIALEFNYCEAGLV